MRTYRHKYKTVRAVRTNKFFTSLNKEKKTKTIK